jgi:hypothetical protein
MLESLTEPQYLTQHRLDVTVLQCACACDSQTVIWIDEAGASKISFVLVRYCRAVILYC